ncbi:MAG: hypothetical protein AAGA75_16945 [Cyanobacteria bacterium P01_E01_bin.6]
MEIIILARSKFLNSFAALLSATVGLIMVAIAYWKMRTKHSRSRMGDLGYAMR